MQQMVKLEEEMDRRPATVVWATETSPHKNTVIHTCSWRNTTTDCPLTQTLTLLTSHSELFCHPPAYFFAAPANPPTNFIPLSHQAFRPPLYVSVNCPSPSMFLHGQYKLLWTHTHISQEVTVSHVPRFTCFFGLTAADVALTRGDLMSLRSTLYASHQSWALCMW